MLLNTSIPSGRIISGLVFLSIMISSFGIISADVSNNERSGLVSTSIFQDDTARINSFIKKGNYYLSKKEFKLEEAKAYIDSAMSVCEKESITVPASLNLLKADFYYFTGDFTQSEEEMNQSLEKAQNSNDYSLIVRSLLFEGKYYLRTFSFRESGDAYMKSINVSRDKKMKGTIPLGYEGIANVMEAAGDIKGLRDNLAQMINAAFSEKDTLIALAGLLRLGSSYDGYGGAERNSRLADSLLRKCNEISDKINAAYYSAYSAANLGWNFYCEKNYDSALFYYIKSMRISQMGKQEGTAANSIGNIGNIYRDLGEYDKAIKYYTWSLNEAKKINDYYTLGWVSEDMSKLYLRKNDTSNAYKNYVLFKEYNDTLQLRKSSQGLLDARIKYEADNHKKEVDLLSLRLKNNRLLNIGFTGLIILISIIGILIVRGAKNEERRRLSELNRKISELTQANLRQQMNPHFIFNTLNSIQYFMFQHDKLATNSYLTKFSSLMRKVLENSQHTSVPLRDELDALTLYLELESLRFKDKFEYVLTVDEEIDPLLYKVPTMLMQPYVENSICHGLKHLEGKGSVKIDIKLGNGILICTIEDNGIGREAAREIDNAKGAKHNSLGMRITNSRLDLVNSLYGTSFKTVYTDLKDEGGQPAGTRVEIQIPVLT